MGLKAKLKTAVSGMTLGQKIATVFITMIVPVGTWLAIGIATNSWQAVEAPSAVAGLAVAEIAAAVSSISVVFGLSPPAPVAS